MEDLIEQVAQSLVRSKNAVALTGAGISTESGIPDFRSPGGLWTRVDPGEFSIDRFLQNPARFWRLHSHLKETGEFDLASAEPNAAHLALSRMEQMGILKCIITQNVDNLHQRAGSVEVVEFHGNMLRAVCLKCRALEPIREVEARLTEDSEEAPRCQKCGGLLKPDAVFFGEAIPGRAVMISQVQSRKCDLLLVIGTSLQVYPAAQIPLSVKLKHPPAMVVEVNREPSAMYNQVSDVLLLGSAAEILSRLMETLEDKVGERASQSSV
jgi:NAD-dependent deacetylase